MVEIGQYIYNIQNDNLVMYPGHSTLSNISHIHKIFKYMYVKRWNSKSSKYSVHKTH